MDSEYQKKLEEIIWSLKTREEIDEVEEMLNHRWNQLTKQAAAAFRPGEDVKWTHKGRAHTGHVIKCNVKTIDVHENNSDKAWRITATELEHV